MADLLSDLALQTRALDLPAEIEAAEREAAHFACSLEDDKATFILSQEFADLKLSNEAARKAAVTVRFVEREDELNRLKSRLHRLQNDFSAAKAVLRFRAASEE